MTISSLAGPPYDRISHSGPYADISGISGKFHHFRHCIRGFLQRRKGSPDRGGTQTDRMAEGVIKGIVLVVALLALEVTVGLLVNIYLGAA